MNSFSLGQLCPTAEPDLVRQALGGPESVPPEMEPRLHELSRQALQAAAPRGTAQIATITSKEAQQTCLSDETCLLGLGVAGLARQCEMLAAFAVSLGPGPEELIDQAALEGRLTDMTLLDVIASEAVESLAEQAEEAIGRWARSEGRAITRRYSPGYCDWNLSDQQTLDQLIHFRVAGIQLSQELIMIPEKSVSAIVGIGFAGSEGQVLSERPACKQCPHKSDCTGPRAN